jgi:hypothetical protein
MTLIYTKYLIIFENLSTIIKITSYAFRLLIAGGKPVIKSKIISYYNYFSYGKDINNLYNLYHKTLTR